MGGRFGSCGRFRKGPRQPDYRRGLDARLLGRCGESGVSLPRTGPCPAPFPLGVGVGPNAGQPFPSARRDSQPPGVPDPPGRHLGGDAAGDGARGQTNPAGGHDHAGRRIRPDRRRGPGSPERQKHGLDWDCGRRRGCQPSPFPRDGTQGGPGRRRCRPGRLADGANDNYPTTTRRLRPGFGGQQSSASRPGFRRHDPIRRDCRPRNVDPGRRRRDDGAKVRERVAGIGVDERQVQGRRLRGRPARILSAASPGQPGEMAGAGLPAPWGSGTSAAAGN